MNTLAALADAAPSSSAGVSARSFTLHARDGYGLGATLYSPRRAVGTVIIHGATATPQRYYRKFAEFLAEGGLRVLTYDYRGVGESRPPTLVGFAATMTDWAELDATAAHSFVRLTFGDGPVVSVGHSFGGQLLGLTDEAHDVRGTLLVGAQLGYYGHWSGRGRVELALVWKAWVPAATTAFGYLPGRLGLGEDLPSGVAREWATWCSSEGYLMSHHADARDRFARFGEPTLLYSFTDDDYAPRRSVNALLERLVTARVEHRRVSPGEHGGKSIGHFGFFKPRFRDTLWTDARAFLAHAATSALRGFGEPRRLPRFQVEAPYLESGDIGITQEDVLADLSFGRD